jgi:uncharacterized membrane protein
MPTDVEHLFDISFFESLDDEERALLAQHLDHRSYPADTTIFRDGEPGGAMYIIHEGEVELWLFADDKTRVRLATFGPGEFFGELSLLDQEPRSATATTLRDTDVLIVDREDLRILFSKKPDAALDVIGVLGRRLRETNLIVRSRAARNVNEVFEEKLSLGDRLADWFTARIGTMGFIYANLIWFGAWILLNLGHATGFVPFDPFPFGLLTMIVSLEAIFLSLFVLISQNRSDAKDRLRSELDYRVNVKSEIEVAQLHEKVETMRQELLQAISRASQQPSGNAG